MNEPNPGELVQIDWREAALREANTEYEERVRSIEATYKLSLWAARKLYKEKTDFVKGSDPNSLNLEDPITGNLLGWNQTQEEPEPVEYNPPSGVLSEEEVVAAVPPGDQEKAINIYSMVKAWNGPFSAKQFIAQYNSVHSKAPLDLPDFRRLIKEWVEAGSILKASAEKVVDGAPTGERVTYYQDAAFPVDIETGIKKLSQKAQPPQRRKK